jgi:hypothetical protein
MNKITNNDQWLKELRKRLADYEEPRSESDWDDFACKLQQTSHPKTVIMPVRHRRIYAMAAAIAVLIGISILLFQTMRPIEDTLPKKEIAQTIQRINSNPTAQPSAAAVTEPTSTASTLASALSSAVLASAHKSQTAVVATNANEIPVTMIVPSDTVKKEVEKKEAVATPSSNKNNTVVENKATTPSQGHHYRRMPNKQTYQKETPHRPISFAVALGSNGSVKVKNSSDGGVADNLYADPANPFTHILVLIPSDVKVKYDTYNFNHRIPISVGVNVRKDLGYHLSAETGLVFTLLSSEVNSSVGTKVGNQNIIFVGIPVKGNLGILEKGKYQIYISAGGMIERCIYANLKGRNLGTNIYQFSINGGVGAQYNLSKRLGIYLETGVAHYYDNKSGIKTSRTEHPTNINIQGGLRITY